MYFDLIMLECCVFINGVDIFYFSAREAVLPKEEENELIKARNLALKVMLRNKFGEEEESESKALENGSNIDDMEHSNYSAECLDTYIVNTNGICNETKHFCAWNTLNKSYCPHRKTFG